MTTRLSLTFDILGKDDTPVDEATDALNELGIAVEALAQDVAVMLARRLIADLKWDKNGVRLRPSRVAIDRGMLYNVTLNADWQFTGKDES